VTPLSLGKDGGSKCDRNSCRFLPDSTVLQPRVVFGGWCSEWDVKVHGRVHSRAGNQSTQGVLQHIVCRVMWYALREAAE